jgi:integrase
VKLLILTGQRRSQIWKLQPEWIEGDLVTFPAGVMKTGNEHAIPVGPFTRDLMRKVAPLSFNGWGKCKARMDRETGVKGWVLHDLRRTFVTNCARFRIPFLSVERYVAHTSGSFGGIVSVYNRHDYLDEMRELASRFETSLLLLVDQRGEHTC